MAGTSMRRTVRRALALTLSFAMVWGGVPVPALAQMANEVIVEEEPTSGGEVVPQEETPQTPVEQGGVEDGGELVDVLPDIVLDPATSPNAEENNDELLDAYVQQMLDEAIPGATVTRTFGTKNAGDKLEGANATLYQAFKDMAIQAAKGEIDTTEVTIACKDLQSDLGPWSADDLGVQTLVQNNKLTREASDAMWSRILISLDRVVRSLLADCPYDLFWYDKTMGTQPTISGIYSVYDATGTTVTAIDLHKAEITFKMRVSAYYSLNGAQGTTAIDKDRIADINGVVAGAVNRAQSIVAANSGKDTLERLKAYKQAICDLVSYNDDAAVSTSIPYGDPWQLIWVFDDKVENNQGNPETKVVCEGYSKAFKYLCDLTWPDPATGIECILVSGTMDVSDAEDGAHMWNIVHMDDGNNYLVDVTNCDTGTVGYSEQLFMRYNENNEVSTGSFEGGYTFKPQDYSERTVTYKYGDATTLTFSKDELTLSTVAYEPPVTLLSIEPPQALSNLEYNGQTQAGVPTGNGYSLSGVTSATNAGTYEATATLNDGYKWSDNTTGPKTIAWTIAPASISGATVTAENQTYAGADLTPAPTVKISGEPLDSDTDYTCAYQSNHDVGTATVTVTGKGNYTGTASGTFQITKAHLSVTAKAKTIMYGDAPANDGVEYSGFKGSDGESSLGGTLSYAYSYTQYGDAGHTYTITPSGLTSNNYEISFASGTLTVNARPVTLQWTNTTFSYDGQPHVPTATAGGLVNNDAATINVTGAKSNVGTHTATAESISNTNYCLPDNNTCEFSIGKGTLNPSVSIEGWTYGQTAKTPVVYNNTSNGDVIFRYGKQGDNPSTYKATVPTNAGDYVVQATIAETGNYHSATATANFTIAKAQSRVSQAPSANTLTYTSAFQALVTAGTAEGGTLLYSLDNSSWSDEVPSATNAGEYKVWYKVRGDENHEDTESAGPIDVTIAKAANTLTVDEAVEVTLGNSVELQQHVRDAKGNVTYELTGQTGGCAIDADGTFTTGTQAGTYNVTVSAAGNGNYNSASKDIAVHVGGDLAQATIALADTQSPIVYNGSQHTPELVVSIGSTPLTKDSDYEVTYGTNVNAGEATATIARKDGGNYVGTKVFTFMIARKPVTVTANDKTKTYGSADPASFSATTSGTVGTDTVTYSVSRATGENVGTYDITPSGAASQGNYSVTYAKGTFTITPASIADAQVSVAAQTYTGSALTPKPTVTFAGKTLREGTDYTLSYSDNNTNVGTASVTITAKDGGNFTGTKTVNFQIAGKPVEVRAKDANKVFGSNDPVPFEATVTGTVGEDTVSYTVNRAAGESAGKYAITPSGEATQGNYVVTYIPGTFTITPASIAGAQMSSIPAQTYTGSALKPKPTVTYAGKTLREGTDYTLSYTNNTNAGTATVTATGKGNYTGSKSTTFRINPAAITSVSLSQTSFTYDGGAKRPGVTVKAGSRTVPASGYSVSYTNNVNVGTATVTVSGKGNYAGSRSATFRIVAPPEPEPAPEPTPHVSYRTHVQRIGWQGYVSDGAMSGTSGRSFRLEGINIYLSDMPCGGGIEYRTHVQRIGWQGWRRDNAMAGTKGRSFRLEAIEIQLYGEMANRYDVYYRVHCQRFGWMGWAKNGQRSGSAGYSRRLEGIQIVLVPKGQPGPGPTLNGITQRFSAPFKQKGKK